MFLISVCRYGIDLGVGLGPTLYKILRVGIMGVNANVVKVEAVLKSLKEGLEQARTL
jgi:aspartate aminotransferase-like enzyme